VGAFTTDAGLSWPGSAYPLAESDAQPGEDFYLQLVKANDARIPNLIAESPSARTRQFGVRGVGTSVEALAAAFCAPESSYFKSDALISPLEKASTTLLKAQHPDGTTDSGNLSSPPDTGFVVQTVCKALTVLRRSDSPLLAQTKANLEKFILAAGEALATGGLHTPNHRWVVSSALAQTNALFPSAKYVDRINDWLGEGVYCDADGQFSERSTGIYSRVIDNGLLTLARLLPRPELLEPVRRNLEMNIYYTHPDGGIETVGSRRQDQYMTTASIGVYYLQYRYMAIRDKNPLFAAVAKMIEQMGETGEVSKGDILISFLEEPLLRQELPESEPLPSNYAKVFSNTHLARIRRGETSATIYGGSDWPLGVASGLASNPTFFTFRKGKAVLESVRMSPICFSEGFFRSKGLRAEGNQYFLEELMEVPYYQPLPRDKRNPQGDYRLTPADDRFWSKMDFPDRPKSNIQRLDQKVTVVENNGVFELEFDISGHDQVPVTIQLAFRRGGKLEGPTPVPGKENVFFLKEGTGRYSVGDDVIEFGPGEAEHEYIQMEGESYLVHNGSLKPDGYCVYITGFTPFQRKLTIR
jgi:hypothetical protein